MKHSGTSCLSHCVSLQRSHKEVCPVRGFCPPFANKRWKRFVTLQKSGLALLSAGEKEEAIFVKNLNRDQSFRRRLFLQRRVREDSVAEFQIVAGYW